MTAFVPATEKQTAFITDLLTKRVLKAETAKMMADAVAGVDDKSVSKTQASKWIEWLLAQPKVEVVKAAMKTYVDPPEGMHVLDGKVTKVYRTRGGYIVAKALVQIDGKWGFEYRGKSGLKGLSEDTKMSEEQAKAWGKTYGICVNCAADLTDERSIFAGYGPVCAKNYGWWYPTMSEALDGLGLSEKGEAMTKLVELTDAEIEAITKAIDELTDDELVEPLTLTDVSWLTFNGYAGYSQEMSDEVEAHWKRYGGTVEDSLKAVLSAVTMAGSDDAAIFDIPPIPTLTTAIGGGGSTSAVTWSGGGGGSSGGGMVAGGGGAGGVVTHIPSLTTWPVTSDPDPDSDPDEDEDGDEPEFIEIPLTDLLLDDDL